MSATTLLADIRSRVVVDVDSNDSAVAARHTDGTVKFCDMTSNQAIVHGEATRPEQKALLLKAIDSGRTENAQAIDDHLVDNIIDHFTVLLATTVYPYLTGSVHAQTSPAFAYDTEKTVAHAKRLVSIYEANGIPKSRVCIKIPSTPESIVACQYLEKIGIRTLATCLFSVPQAVAASQAGCLYVAPYFNELRVHFEPSLWREYKDTASEHPMAIVIYDIVETYKRIGSKTLVMPASIVTAAEVSALASLHPDHLTLSGSVLDQLAALPAPSPSESAAQVTLTPEAQEPETQRPSVELSAPPASAETADGSTKDRVSSTSSFPDYLASSAAPLREALAVDAESTRKLADALKIFGEMESKLREIIKAELTKA
ncbi:aldolase [Stereum hirsutum FP-91666 SS1]|uniref:aldolase n=1 Tax=Stereum hirsutum (strain FP-91666) TaxID=721885 RepID=UPI0004449375|nr:aldolase [Stereum hirsutum FP-91666 SS1]EIM82164.1 aldolase [Stereum hirsutum FP-91666 SS1]